MYGSVRDPGTAAALLLEQVRFYHVRLLLICTWYIIKIKIHSSCEIDFLSKLIFASCV